MSSEIIQADFGGFNPRFMGVSVKLDSPEALQIWYDSLTGETSSGDKPSSLLEIAIKSVLAHEICHYHDFLISPYSSHLLRLRFQGLSNGLQALSCIRHLEGNCLTVPLSRWRTMDESERVMQLDDWKELARPPDSSKWQPVKVPLQSRKELLSDLPGMIIDVRRLSDQQRFELHMEAAIRGYLRIEQLVRGFGDFAAHPELRPCNVYEATALTVQITSIYQSQGFIPAVQFVRYLLDSHVGYALLWQQFFQMALLLEKQRHPGLQVSEALFAALPTIMSIGVWCLLGNYKLESTKACPTVRFEKLLRHIVKDYRDFT